MFCSNCGKYLADDEVCTCQQQQAQPNAWSQGQPAYQAQPPYQGQPQVNEQQVNQSKENQSESFDLFDAMHQISRKIGKVLDAIYNFVSPAKRSGRFSNMLPVRNLLGLSREDRLEAMGDCFERGKKIVPDLVQPCGQEIPIRQYELCSCRSLIRGLWQEGRLQVTNKRVLFRLSGRNWVGKALTNVEFSLEEIAGMDIKTSNKISFVTLWMNLLYSALFAAIGFACLRLSAEVFAILGIVLFVLAHLLVRNHYYFKLAVMSLCSMWFLGGMQSWFSKFWIVLLVISAIFYLVYLLLSSLKPNLSFAVLTKCNSSGPIRVQRENRLEQLFSWNLEVLPGKDALRAMDEVGTMINDIQRFGDFGIEKWKE